MFGMGSERAYLMSLPRRPRDLASAPSAEGKRVGTICDAHINHLATIGTTLHKRGVTRLWMFFLLLNVNLCFIGCTVLWNCLYGPISKGLPHSGHYFAAATELIERVAVRTSRSSGSLGTLALGDCSHLRGMLLAHVEKVEALAHAKLTAGWSWILAHFSTIVIGGALTFAFHQVVYFGAWMPWLLLNQFPYFDRFKIQPKKQADSQMMWSCLNWLFIIHFFFQLPLQLLFHPHFATALPLPPARAMLWQLPAFFVIEDFYFYWAHRALHHKYIYKYIHKIHHEHKHPFGVTAEYAHPAETLLLGFASVLGPLIIAPHMVTLWAWLLVKLWQTVECHSGYDLPFNPTNLIPFWGGSVQHDFHHRTFDGCYGSVFTWCDWMFGTDVKFRAHQKKLRGGKEGCYPAQFRGAPNVVALEANTANKANKAKAAEGLKGLGSSF